MDISHTRVCKEMRALGLVQQTPSELPPAPAPAAAALFMGMHERLGAYSLVFLLDVPLLAYILDLYATIYMQLPGVDEFGDLAPWSTALLPAQPHAHVATTFTVAQSVSTQAEIIEPRLQERSAPVPSARRRSRVLHLPSAVSASPARASGPWHPRQAWGQEGLAEGELPTYLLPSASGIDHEGGVARLKKQPSRGESDGGNEHEQELLFSAEHGTEVGLEMVLSQGEAQTRAAASRSWKSRSVRVDQHGREKGKTVIELTRL